MNESDGVKTEGEREPVADLDNLGASNETLEKRKRNLDYIIG